MVAPMTRTLRQFPWGAEGEEGPWNSEQKSIGGAHVSCLSYTLLSPPSTALLYNLCRRGFYFCVYFFICVCTLFVWWDKDRRGEAGGLGLVDKTALQLGTRTGLFQFILLPRTIQNERLQCLEEKCVAIRLWSALSLPYAAALDTHVLVGLGKSECYFKKRDIFTQHCISLTERCHLVAVPCIIYLVPL